VGGGPFPTEDRSAAGELLRERGREYGSVTGRSRRCGWIDLPVLRYSAAINGLDCLIITKLDVLDALGEIPVCTGYEYKGTVTEELPAVAEDWERLKPVYQVLPGWKQPTFGLNRYEDLPRQARSYLDFISGRVGVEIAVISTGPERSQSIVIEGSRLEKLLPASSAAHS
jgi:adenylosuccinate synthase